MKKIILLFNIFISFSYLYGQQSITGRIIDEQNIALPGVSVIINNSQRAVVSDMDGNYKITASPQDTLVFSMVGLTPQRIYVGTQAVINITLLPSVQVLNEVVVIGYGTVRKSDLTGAVSSVKGNDITKIPSFSPEQALQGKMAGVQVASTSGAPGSVPMIRVRGVGTLNNSSPIFVVDGVILDDISFLSSGDIQSMEVLKDASSTAIYGSRGANGVIIVTTKLGSSGKDRKLLFDVSADFSVQVLSKKIGLLNGQEFAQVVNEINPGKYNPSRVSNTNWQNEIFNKFSQVHNYHASVTGSSEKYNYYFGLGYFRQTGIISKSDYERISIKLNNTYSLSEKIKVGTNITISPDIKNNEAGVVPMLYRAWPTSVPYKDDGLFAEVGGAGNPIASIIYNNSSTKRFRGVGNFFTDIKFLKDFTFKSSLGVDLSYPKDKNYTPAYYVGPLQSNELSSLSTSIVQYYTWLWENTLTYDKRKGDHYINLLAGITTQRNNSENYNIKTKNLIGNDPSLWFTKAGELQYLTADNGSEITSMESFLFRANYTFKNRYLSTISFRRDGSSKFGINNRWGNFPSLALGWNVSNESFMSNLIYISNLKLRASWGIVGNEKINGTKQYSLVDNNQTAVFRPETPSQGATYAVSGNSDLKWESTTQKDIGLEIGLWKNKFKGEFDYYRKTTDGILVDLFTPGHLGNGPFASVPYNAAKVLNEGFELTVSWADNIGSFDYKIGAVASTVHNEVLALGATKGNGSFITNGSLGNSQNVTRTEVGQPVGSFFGYQVIGVFQNQTEIEGSPKIDGQKIGDLRFADISGSEGIPDGVIDAHDRTFIGSYIPKLMFGFYANVGYKNFDLSLDFNGQQGNKIYNGKNAVRPDLYNFESRVENRWHGEGTSNSEPRATSGGLNYEPSTYFIENGDFIRLRNLSIGYTFRSDWTTKLKFSSAKIYLRGTNLFTLTKYSGYTPEIASNDALGSGIDLGVYPLTSYYTIGLNLSF